MFHVFEIQIILQTDNYLLTQAYLLILKLWLYNNKFDVIVDRGNICFVECVKSIETYYGQLPVILGETLQYQTVVTRQIKNVHVEDR